MTEADGRPSRSVGRLRLDRLHGDARDLTQRLAVGA